MPQMRRARAERYRAIAGTLSDPVLARRMLDYADELSSAARPAQRAAAAPAAPAPLASVGGRV